MKREELRIGKKYYFIDVDTMEEEVGILLSIDSLNVACLRSTIGEDIVTSYSKVSDLEEA